MLQVRPGQLVFTNSSLPQLGQLLRVCDRLPNGRYAFLLNGQACTCKRSMRYGTITDIRTEATYRPRGNRAR